MKCQRLGILNYVCIGICGAFLFNAFITYWCKQPNPIQIISRVLFFNSTLLSLRRRLQCQINQPSYAANNTDFILSNGCAKGIQFKYTCLPLSLRRRVGPNLVEMYILIVQQCQSISNLTCIKSEDLKYHMGINYLYQSGIIECTL